jgi:hypothetical protein
MNQRQKDLNFGQNFENVNLEILSKYFKCDELMKTKSSRDPFDYIDKKNKVIIELKARRNTKEQYYDTMIGHNKIITGFNHIKNGYKVYLCFQFTDGLFYYELNEDTYDNNWVRTGGRRDRGSVEINQYCYVPNKILTKIV